MHDYTHAHKHTRWQELLFSGPPFHTRDYPLSEWIFFFFFKFLTDSLPCEAAWKGGVVLLSAKQETLKKRNCVREKKRLDAHIKWQQGSHLSSLGAHKDVNQFKCHIEHCSNNAFDRNTECTYFDWFFLTVTCMFWLYSFKHRESKLEKGWWIFYFYLFIFFQKKSVSMYWFLINIWTLLIIFEFREFWGFGTESILKTFQNGQKNLDN